MLYLFQVRAPPSINRLQRSPRCVLQPPSTGKAFLLLCISHSCTINIDSINVSILLNIKHHSDGPEYYGTTSVFPLNFLHIFVYLTNNHSSHISFFPFFYLNPLLRQGRWVREATNNFPPTLPEAIEMAQCRPDTIRTRFTNRGVSRSTSEQSEYGSLDPER